MCKCSLLLWNQFYEISYLVTRSWTFLHAIIIYHMINEVHTTYPVTRAKKNIDIHVRESAEE